MFKIEKNVEIPVRSKGGKGVCTYPFNLMSVGDSFILECADEEKIKRQGSLTSSARQYSSRYGGGELKFSTRKVEGGVRIWRIK